MPKIYIHRGGPYGFEVVEGEYLAALRSQPVPPKFYSDDAPEVAAWLSKTSRAAATAAVAAFANGIREKIAKASHYLQAARWPIQLASAQAVKAGTASAFDTAILAREARLRGRGETVEQLADKVIGNSLVFASVGAAVDGVETATLDAIAGYAGSDAAEFAKILASAKATAQAEFLDIFSGVYGPAQAKALAAQFFGS